jgi:hypothetical protein
MRFCTAIELAFPGEIFRNASAIGTTRTGDTAAGPNEACGAAFLPFWQLMPATNMRCSTAPSCERISIARAPKKTGENQAIGKSKGGLISKFHVLADALGNPQKVLLTAGLVHDRPEQMRSRLEWRQMRCWRTRHLTQMNA